ncbi:hypothetical protein F5B22DRAFT_190881 [Xylaria bambusicola]|uniref:uncharacterized protein n=1 Tax=Xylaria bambusicola TaxID=326684 RepID=UPI002007297F|nr:uncharacterized protein F5B22DRAFT_190881 [Xylaria bambusicola]KAI0515445.1 hypothetical protein F5B22DRAFT_190881 [Xylaria bambusicola]
MHSKKVFFSLGSLAAGSLAQSSEPFSSDPSCPSSLAELSNAAPSPPAYVQDILPNPTFILGDPEGYASEVCRIATELPASQLSEFGVWGSSLLSYVSSEASSYDALVTKCYATGAQGAAATSYINSIASRAGPLCEVTSTPGGGSGPSNGTSTITPAPTSMATSTGAPNSTTSAMTSIPVGLAAKPTGVLAGAVGAAGLLAAAILL